MLCGRPDGRLSSLTSLETSACLSVNQACSIQSIGGTCECVTIGHNPFKLPLSERAIFLRHHRPKFLCEKVFSDAEKTVSSDDQSMYDDSAPSSSWLRNFFQRSISILDQSLHAMSLHRMNIKKPAKKTTVLDRSKHARSAAELQGLYMDLAKEAGRGAGAAGRKLEVVHAKTDETLEEFIESEIEERRRLQNLRSIFDLMDADGNGRVDWSEFSAHYFRVDNMLSEKELRILFDEIDSDGSGELDYEEFLGIANMKPLDVLRTLQSIRRPRSLIQVEPSKEVYFGQNLERDAPEDVSPYSLQKFQRFSMELYETRVASMQRFVSITVMFHQMGRRVQDFFPRYSLGLFGYRMDRSHSITRIQTTASPISGAHVRERIKVLEFRRKVKRAVEMVSFAWHRLDKKRNEELKEILGLSSRSLDSRQGSNRSLITAERLNILMNSNDGGALTPKQNGSSVVSQRSLVGASPVLPLSNSGSDENDIKASASEDSTGVPSGMRSKPETAIATKTRISGPSVPVIRFEKTAEEISDAGGIEVPVPGTQVTATPHPLPSEKTEEEITAGGLIEI